MSTSYSGRTSVQGEGGKFQSGGGSIDMGDGLNVPITVTFYTDTSGAEEAKQKILEIGDASKTASGGTDTLTNSQKENDKIAKQQLASYRSVTWDFMLLGRSLSIVNNTFLGHNQVLKDAIGLIYGISAVMRVYLVIKDLTKALEIGHTTAMAAQTVATNAQTAAVWGQVSAYSALAVVTGGGSIAAGAAGGAVRGGITGIAGGMGVLGGFASGGYVNQTGLYMMHAGETVIPKGGPTMTMININMQTGGISSNIDVDNMLNAMAGKMALESRRRSGR